MKNIISLFILFQLITFTIFAQIPIESDLKWSEPQQGQFNEYWGNTEKYIVMAERYKEKYKSPVIINSKDYTIAFRSETKNIIIEKNKYRYINGKVFNDKLFAIVRESKESILRKKDDVISYLIQYSLPNLVIEKKWKLKMKTNAYYKQENSFTYEMEIKNYKPFAQFLISSNNKHLHIIGLVDYTSTTYSIMSFDSNLELSEKAVKIPGFIQDHLIQDDIISDIKGNIFMLYHTDYKKEDNKINKCGIIDLLSGEKFDWNIEAYNIINRKMVIRDHNIHIGGIGSENENYSIYYTSFDRTNGFDKLYKTKLEMSTLLKGKTDEEIEDFNKNKSLDIINYSCDNIDFTNDGNMIIYGEMQFSFVSSNYISIWLSLNNIWVAYINQDNNLLSYNIISKTQNTTVTAQLNTPISVSYIPIRVNNDMHFIYQTNKVLKNKNATNQKFETTNISTIDKNGILKTKQWCDNKKTKTFINPLTTFVKSNGKMVIPSISSKYSKFSEFTLDNLKK